MFLRPSFFFSSSLNKHDYAVFSAFPVITFLQYKVWDKNYIPSQVIQLHKSVILLPNVHSLHNTTDLHVFQV